MKNFFTAFLLSCTAFNFFSCSHEKEQIKSTSNPPVLTKTPNTHKDVVKVQQQTFIKPWEGFRQAVIEQDTAKISGFTKFPFETSGPMDSDPIIKYSQKDFSNVFKAFLAETVLDYDSLQGQVKEINQFEVIRKTIIPKKEYVTDSLARVGNLEFNKVNNRWYLTFAYLEYPTIEAIAKELK